MKRVVLALVALFSIHATAQYANDVQVQRIHTKSNGYAYFGIANPPDDTCNWYGEIFRFDITTEAGQAMLSNLLLGKASGNQISVWYQISSTPGTTSETGCTESSLAVVTGIAQQ